MLLNHSDLNHRNGHHANNDAAMFMRPDHLDWAIMFGILDWIRRAVPTWLAVAADEVELSVSKLVLAERNPRFLAALSAAASAFRFMFRFLVSARSANIDETGWWARIGRLAFFLAK